MADRVYSRFDQNFAGGNKIALGRVWSTLNRNNFAPVENENARFEQTILPHLDAAYNLARWLTGNEHDARDMVQESFLRALKFFGNFRGGDARAWLLTIVRNTVYTWLKRRQTRDQVLQGEEEMEKFEDASANPEQLLERSANIELVRGAIAQCAHDSCPRRSV